ncbi:MAG: hypothetical protein COT71_02685 [Candidatus Andersenbacteria bacterium CG10_big_fil_rev_8_21_14_0_10_54_11]|uniref:Uncharacterized protein n=1 Tax=Candidatus Andersenbacteria bacterium CG10_big_fil_rev_8_21_14_0_10_54_11 TaxID=1974485 RepID=A0A2M6WZ86_9BACT|nr:MAG: hypothetical protein COT71_02685 [Candidatus Andersenbacteria bacterium CG10_big_fil_rev_8_21_14_0_10_54_11]
MNAMKVNVSRTGVFWQGLKGGLITAAAVMLDQGSKAASLTAANRYRLPPQLEPSPHYRSGALMLLAAALAAVLFVLASASSRSRQAAGLWLMLGGAAGNLIDYLYRGSIINIITVGRIQLNLADIMVYSGAIWLLTTKRETPITRADGKEPLIPS